MKTLGLLVLLLGSSCVVVKTEVPDLVAAEASSRAQFERLKELEGRWVGTALPGSEPATIESVWCVTAGGSAIEERLFAGTDHEMISVIHRDGPYLMLTHFCSAGNQPRMRAIYTSPPVPATGCYWVDFSFLDATNLASKDDLHMAAVHLDVSDANHMQSSWTAEAGGKPDHTAKFAFTRQP
jgi:hypothetical protein